MCTRSYDENLDDNPFFTEIIRNHNDLLRKASENNWIICVPKSGSTTTIEITENLIHDHILIPNGAPQAYTTLSGRPVTVLQHEIIDEHKTPILFQETFYVKHLKYKVLCLAKPLFSIPTLSTNDHPLTLHTLDDCIDFLWQENLEHLLLDIQSKCAHFLETQKSFQLENLHRQAQLARGLYTECLELVSEPCDNTRLAIETYLQSCLNHNLTKAINTLTCFSDATFNKTVRNLHNFLDPQELNYDGSELNKINNYNTVLDKLHCLKLAYDRQRCATTDDVIQSFVGLVIHSTVTNWWSNLVYLRHFQFSNVEVSNEGSYLVASLEAALEYIKCGTWSPKRVRYGAVFDTIAEGTLTQIHALLEYNKDSNKDLCHPLCDCQRCLLAASPMLTCTNPNGQNLLSYAVIVGRLDMVQFLLGKKIGMTADHYGKTPLHYACQYGRQDILLLVLERYPGPGVNTKDLNGDTALHLACQNGHENCVKALFYTTEVLQVNALNRDNEAPLHLAIKYNYIEIVRILLDNRASMKRVNLEHCQNYYVERMLWQKQNEGSPPSMFGQRPKSMTQNRTIDRLLKAIENNDLPLAYFYLGFPPASVASPSYDFRSKCHPLCSCEKCYTDEGQPPVSSHRKLSVNACNCDGFTPLHFAAKYGRDELLRVLLDAQASPNVKTYKTLQTPLHLGCIHQRVNVVKELVQCGDCDLEAVDYKGLTAFHYASAKRDGRIMELLHLNGADTESYRGVMT